MDKPSHKQLVQSIGMFIVMLPLSVVERPSFLDEDQLLILHVFLEHLTNHQDIIKADIHLSHARPKSTFSITCWKVAGALQRLKGITPVP